MVRGGPYKVVDKDRIACVTRKRVIALLMAIL
jgi:hypothetical protein